MRAGDGAFVNCSCYHNVLLQKTYNAHPANVSAKLRSLIALYKPSRYGGCVAYLANYVFRDISQHEEITLHYNELDNGLMDVSDVVGGCFHAYDCKCGYPFCCGPIIYRLIDGIVTETDAWFFPLNVDDKLCIDMNEISAANAMYLAMFPGWKRGVSVDTGELDNNLQVVVAKLKENAVVRREVHVSVATLLNKFNLYLSKCCCTPMYMPREKK